MHAYREPRDAAQAIESVLKTKSLRSADKANMQTMLKQVRRGNALDYQQRYNLWAYVNRYEHGGAG
jgi:2-phosphoglycerate kinase